MDVMKADVYKITQWKDGCVYKTRKVKSIWVSLTLSDEEQVAVAKQHGGDMLAPTTEYRFGVKEIPQN